VGACWVCALEFGKFQIAICREEPRFVLNQQLLEFVDQDVQSSSCNVLAMIATDAVSPIRIPPARTNK
jgi:hypothetical protein